MSRRRNAITTASFSDIFYPTFMMPQFSLLRAEALDFSMAFDSGYDPHHTLPFKTLNLSRFSLTVSHHSTPRDLTSSND